MKVEVLFFGILAEKAGTDRLSLEGAGDVKTLKKKIFIMHPDLENFSFRVSVNKDLVEDDRKLRNGDEVALLPPFAGG
jgi:molybdopterin converting factor small subunit